MSDLMSKLRDLAVADQRQARANGIRLVERVAADEDVDASEAAAILAAVGMTVDDLAEAVRTVLRRAAVDRGQAETRVLQEQLATIDSDIKAIKEPHEAAVAIFNRQMTDMHQRRDQLADQIRTSQLTYSEASRGIKPGEYPHPKLN